MRGEHSPILFRLYFAHLTTIGQLIRIAALLLTLLSVGITPIHAEEIRTRLRVVWTSASSRPFHGSLSINEGSLKIVQPLAMRDDSPGDVSVATPQKIDIHTAATKYGGVDIEVYGPSRALITFDLDAPDPSQNHVLETWQLSDLMSQSVTHGLDSKETQRIIVARAPGDSLPIRANKDSMVYSPKESLGIFVSGNHTGLHAGSGKLHVSMIDESDGRVLHEEATPWVIDSEGNAPEIDLGSISAPATEGVYRIQLRVEPKRRVGGVLSKEKVERALQFVVVGESSMIRGSDRPWKQLYEVEFEQSSRWKSVPVLRRLAEARKGDEPLSKPVMADGRKVYGLEPQQWRLFDLEKLNPGLPHLVVITAPANAPLEACFSLLDADASGQIESMSVDSGWIHVANKEAELVQHRIVFWPKGASLKLLVQNPSQLNTTWLHRIEVYSNEGLPISKETIAVQKANRSITDWESRGRLIALQLNKPLLPESFNATGDRDPQLPHCYDDWNAFYRSACRLAEYCHWAGYNGAIINVFGEGGSLYPSRRLATTPRFDTGTFFTDGRDPVRKDVVELLMRIFDREGLQLVLSMDVSGPMPTWNIQGNGTDPLAAIQRTIGGEAWPGIEPSLSNRSERYNPLHQTVQLKVEELVEELRERYGDHECWSGVAFHLNGNSHLCFAGDRWGYDRDLLQQFARELGVRLPEDPKQLETLLLGPSKQAWLAWRSQRLAAYYDRVGQRLNKDHRRLYLLTAPLFTETPSSNLFDTPQNIESNPVGALLAHGIDLANWNKESKVELLRGDNLQPLESLTNRRWGELAMSDRNLDSAVQTLPVSGAQFVYHPKPIHLDDLPVKDIYGANVRQAWIFPQMSQSQGYARRAIARRMVSDDCVTFAHGGWIPPFGQEDELRDTLLGIGQLPNRSMETISMDSDSDQGMNVVVRSVVDNGSTFVMLANDAPWMETVTLRWKSRIAQNIRWLSQEPTRTTLDREGGSLPQEIELRPFEVICFEVEDDRAFLNGWTHRADTNVKSSLSKSLAQLGELLNRSVSREGTLLVDPGTFETDPETDGLANWLRSNSPSTKIEIDCTSPMVGEGSLRINNRSEQSSAWIQSKPFPNPATGRLGIEFQLRTDPRDIPSRVSVSVIGRRDNGTKYVYEEVLNLNSASEVPKEQAKLVSSQRLSGKSYFVPMHIDASPESLATLQLAIDVAGPGTVWIDDIRVVDQYLTDEERRAIRSDLFYANRELDRKNFSAAQWLLDSYWSEYLQRFLMSPEEASRHSAAAEDTESSVKKTAERGLLQRMREGIRRSRR